ncbi:MAG: hypothetical protein ACOCZS_00585, partial [Verrucomicrobiota bacterium]
MADKNYMAMLKKYLSKKTFQQYRQRYQECVRMLNGLEKTLERKLPVSDRRWQVAESQEPYGSENELCPPGWSETRPSEGQRLHENATVT